MFRAIAQEAPKTLKWPSGCAHLLLHIRRPLLKLGGRVGYFYFSARGTKRGSRRLLEEGGRFLIDNPRRGVGGLFSQERGGGDRGAERVSAGNWGGGGAILFWGGEMPTKKSAIRYDNLNSAQTRCIVKGKAQKSPFFW